MKKNRPVLAGGTNATVSGLVASSTSDNEEYLVGALPCVTAHCYQWTSLDDGKGYTGHHLFTEEREENCHYLINGKILQSTCLWETRYVLCKTETTEYGKRMFIAGEGKKILVSPTVQKSSFVHDVYGRKTFWSPSSNLAGEWLEIDLGTTHQVQNVKLYFQ